MKTYTIMTLAAAALMSAACAPKNTDSDSESITYEADPVVAEAPEQCDALAVDMFRLLVEQENGNIVFSPASAEAVLHLLRAGARGDTAAELNALPYGKQGVQSAMQVQSANTIFAEEAMNLTVSEDEVQRVPFATAPEKAAKSINSWCSDHTHDKIKEIISSGDITPQTRMIACNAVYLHEKWLHPFEKSVTEKQLFYPAQGAAKKVPTMYHKGSCLYAEGKDWQAVALFYRRDGRPGEPGCFIGILPKGDARAFAANLTATSFNAIRAALAEVQQEEVQIYLPRFTVKTNTFSLKKILQNIGLNRTFDAANFSGFSTEPLSLSDIVQKCYVKVDEHGTEAAAVTASMMRYAAHPSHKPYIIQFNRPFLWVIGDLTTDAPPYFMGLVEMP